MACPPPHSLRRAAHLPTEAPHSFTLASPFLPIPAEILQANDNLTQVINLYKQLVRGEEVNGDAAAGSLPGEEVQEIGRGPQAGGASSRVVH